MPSLLHLPLQHKLTNKPEYAYNYAIENNEEEKKSSELRQTRLADGLANEY